MIQIEMITVGPFQSNCFVVFCSETGDGIVVDAGDDADLILAAVKRLGVNVQAVVNTHAHLDHVSALAEVRDALDVPVLMHRDEIPIYDMIGAQATMFGLTAPRTTNIDRFIGDGETLTVGNLEAEFMLTPGHSPGSVCLYFSGATPPRLIAGDVLFRGSIGRTDLPGGNYDTIMDSLRTRLVPLADETIVYPGHGPETTIGLEKQSNPFVAPLVSR